MILNWLNSNAAAMESFRDSCVAFLVVIMSRDIGIIKKILVEKQKP